MDTDIPNMSTITSKLDQIEIRLQTLIEGHITGLLPVQISRQRLLRELMECLETRLAFQDETLLAPDVFYIRSNPQHPIQHPGYETLLKELGDILQQAGEQAGFTFVHSPTVYAMPIDELALDAIEMQAHFRQDTLEETQALELHTDDEPVNIPRNAFLIVDGSQVFNLDRAVVNIGRRSDNHLIIDDPRVSRYHAQLRATRGRFTIFDLDSTGGTLVNGQSVSQRTLYPRDVISLAGIPLVYAQEEHAPLGPTQQYQPEPPQDDELPTRGGTV